MEKDDVRGNVIFQAVSLKKSIFAIIPSEFERKKMTWFSFIWNIHTYKGSRQKYSMRKKNKL